MSCPELLGAHGLWTHNTRNLKKIMITNSFKNLQYVYLATVDAMLSLPFGSKLMSPDIHMQLLMSFYGIE